MKMLIMTVITALPLMALGQTAEPQQTQGQTKETQATAPAKGKKKQVVTILLGAVVMLGTATALFAKPINDVAYGCDVFHVSCSASPTSR